MNLIQWLLKFIFSSTKQPQPQQQRQQQQQQSFILTNAVALPHQFQCKEAVNPNTMSKSASTSLIDNYHILTSRKSDLVDIQQQLQQSQHPQQQCQCGGACQGLNVCNFVIKRFPFIV